MNGLISKGFLLISAVFFSAAATAQQDTPPITPVTSDTAWIQACQKSVDGKIKGEHYDAEKVTFHSDEMTVTQVSEFENQVAGAGDYVKKDGSWRTFNYQCVYNVNQDAVVSSSYSKASAASEPVPQAVSGPASCTLFNEKSGNNRYVGECTLSIQQAETGNEYQVILGSGDSYQFISQGGTYKVKTPEGWSDSSATLTGSGNSMVFDWYKWTLTIVKN